MVARCGAFSYFVLSVVLLLCLQASVLHCNQFIGKEAAVCFAFLRFMACVLSVLVCLIFPLGAIGRLCSLIVALHDIFYNNFINLNGTESNFVSSKVIF